MGEVPFGRKKTHHLFSLVLYSLLYASINLSTDIARRSKVISLGLIVCACALFTKLVHRSAEFGLYVVTDFRGVQTVELNKIKKTKSFQERYPT